MPQLFRVVPRLFLILTTAVHFTACSDETDPFERIENESRKINERATTIEKNIERRFDDIGNQLQVDFRSMQGQLAQLNTGRDSLSQEQIDTLRTDITEFNEALDRIIAEIQQTKEQLRDRASLVEALSAANDELAALRSQVDELQARVDQAEPAVPTAESPEDSLPGQEGQAQASNGAGAGVLPAQQNEEQANQEDQAPQSPVPDQPTDTEESEGASVQTAQPSEPSTNGQEGEQAVPQDTEASPPPEPATQANGDTASINPQEASGEPSSAPETWEDSVSDVLATLGLDFGDESLLSPEEQQRLEEWREQLPIFDGPVQDMTDRYMEYLAASSDLESHAEDIAGEIIDYRGPELATRVLEIREVNEQVREQNVPVVGLEERITMLDQQINESIADQNMRSAWERSGSYVLLVGGLAAAAGFGISPTSTRRGTTAFKDWFRRKFRMTKLSRDQQKYLRDWKVAFDRGVRYGRWDTAEALEAQGSPVPRLSKGYAESLRRRAGEEGDSELAKRLDRVRPEREAWDASGANEAFTALKSDSQEIYDYYNRLTARLTHQDFVGGIDYKAIESMEEALRFIKSGRTETPATPSLWNRVKEVKRIRFRTTYLDGVDVYTTDSAYGFRSIYRITRFNDPARVQYIGLSGRDSSALDEIEKVVSKINERVDEAVVVLAPEGELRRGLSFSQLSDRTLRMIQASGGALVGYWLAGSLDEWEYLPIETQQAPGHVFINPDLGSDQELGAPPPQGF